MLKPDSGADELEDKPGSVCRVICTTASELVLISAPEIGRHAICSKLWPSAVGVTEAGEMRKVLEKLDRHDLNFNSRLKCRRRL